MFKRAGFPNCSRTFTHLFDGISPFFTITNRISIAELNVPGPSLARPFFIVQTRWSYHPFRSGDLLAFRQHLYRDKGQLPAQQGRRRGGGRASRSHLHQLRLGGPRFRPRAPAARLRGCCRCRSDHPEGPRRHHLHEEVRQAPEGHRLQRGLLPPGLHGRMRDRGFSLHVQGVGPGVRNRLRILRPRRRRQPPFPVPMGHPQVRRHRHRRAGTLEAAGAGHLLPRKGGHRLRVLSRRAGSV